MMAHSAWIGVFYRLGAIAKGDKHVFYDGKRLGVFRVQANGNSRLLIFDRTGMYFTRRCEDEAAAVELCKRAPSWT